MSDWKAELDALLSETMDFTRSLRTQLSAASERPKPSLPRPARPEPASREPVKLEPIQWGGSERAEIQRRVAEFKAHQLQQIRQREDYAAAQWKRMQASRTWPGSPEPSGRP
jgi:hypothetical protein